MTLKKNKQQVIILAGGLSSRMENLTKNKHKTMLKVGGYPILAHLYTQLRINNILEIFISTGFKSDVISRYCKNKIKKDSDKILRLIKKKNRYDYPQIYISKLSSNSSTTERVLKIKKKLNEIFFLIYADTLLKPKILNLLKLFNNKKTEIVMTISKPTPRFGIVKVKKDKLINFSEKNFNNEQWINSGWFLMSKKFLNRFKRKKSNFESYVFNKSKTFSAYIVKNYGFYLPIDHANDLKKANFSWKNNKTLWL